MAHVYPQIDPSDDDLSHSAAVRATLVAHQCLRPLILPHILRPPDPPIDPIMPLTRAEASNVARSTDGPDAATQPAASSRGGTARASVPGPSAPCADPVVRACELFSTLSGKNLVSQLMSRVAGLSRRSARTIVINGGTLRTRGRPPFFTAEEEDAIVDAMGVWAAQGLLLTADTLRLLLKDYIKGMDAARVEQAKSYFGPDASPGRRWFDLFVRRHPTLKPVKPSSLEASRSKAASPEAVAKTFGALSFLAEKLQINHARQVYNMDESMFDAKELLEGAGGKVFVPGGVERLDFVLPPVKDNGAKATVVACVCADGSALPPFVVVPGAPNRVPFMYTTREDGTKKYVPLADLLEDPDAEVRRREPPGFDQELWGEWAHSVARLLGKVRPEEPKLLLLDGCKVHYDLDGLLALRAANVYALMYPSHLSHILQPCDDRVFLALKANGRTHMRALLASIPAGAGFDVRYLLQAIAASWTATMTPQRIKSSFKNCGMWPIDVNRIDVNRLRTGKGTAAAHRAIHMPTLVARLKPEAVRQLEEVTWAYGSISNSGKAVLANSEAVTKAINEKLQADAAKAKEAARKAADKQQRTENRAREALITRDRRARGPIKTVQKKRMLAGAQRQRMRMGLAEFP